MEDAQNYKVTCDSVKVTTLFCFPCGAGVKHLLSEGTVSRSSLALCKAGGFERFPGSATAASRSLSGVQKPLFTPCLGTALLSLSWGHTHPWEGFWEHLSLVAGWGVPGHASAAPHPGAAGKGRGWKINRGLVSRL